MRRAIQAHVEARRLHCLESLMWGEETVRTMFVSNEIYEAVCPPFPEHRDGLRLSEFRQLLDAFLEGGEFSVALDPDRKPSDALLARVHPVEAHVWDLRSIAPKPGIRALGAFSEKDTFIALTWDYRENLDSPGAWAHEIERCRTLWRELFGTQPPFHGATLDEYLSNFTAV
jgi:hypothetical protein